MTKQRSRVTRQMEDLVNKSSLGARDVVKVRRSVRATTTRWVVKASGTSGEGVSQLRPYRRGR